MMMKKTLPVKREVVSATTEIVQEEAVTIVSSPAAPAEMLPTCKKCLQERTRSTAKYKQKARRRQVRSNTPIVIQLKDTLKAALQQRHKTLKKQSSETKDDGDVETDNSSEKGELEADRKRRKNIKNFSAFINVMEKVHRKEAVGMETNLSSDKPSNEKLVAEFVLNNASHSKSSTRSCVKQRSIVDCENVDIICNDLNSIECAFDDTEESEIASTSSSSEIQSDSDISNTQDGPSTQEFTSEELQRLAEFTTGCPLVRYDCPPSQCPQCQWYSNQVYHPDFVDSQFLPKSSHRSRSTKHHAHHVDHHPVPSTTQPTDDYASNSESESEDITDRDTPPECHSQTSFQQDVSVYDLTKYDTSFQRGKKTATCSGRLGWSQRPVTHKQLLDIDIAGKHSSKVHPASNSDQYLDSVYIDLTDTDVSFTVYYHHQEEVLTSVSLSDSCSRLSQNSGVRQLTTHHHGEFPSFSSLPYYQYMYWPGYYPSVCSLPLPLALPDDHSIPKTMMIPPEELGKCESSIRFFLYFFASCSQSKD